MWRFLCILWLSPLPALGQEIRLLDYDALRRDLNYVADFETLPRRAEPGFNLDALYRQAGVWVGEHLSGQTLENTGPHDVLAGRATRPVRVLPGAAGQNQSVAFHKGFGSNALFPLGRAGFPALQARGEGAVSVAFDQPQYAFGLKIHSGYARPLGGDNQAPGGARLRFFDRNGREIAQIDVALETGINRFGFVRAGFVADIVAVTIENDDPGGIALDDLIFDLRPSLS